MLRAVNHELRRGPPRPLQQKHVVRPVGAVADQLAQQRLALRRGEPIKQLCAPASFSGFANKPNNNDRAARTPVFDAVAQILQPDRPARSRLAGVDEATVAADALEVSRSVT